MRLPTFVGIGAARAGTRWLAQCLSEHPQLCLPPHEANFFITKRMLSTWSRGFEWYSSLFKTCVESRVKAWGEITPVYLFDEDSCHLLHRYVPDAKLICCLRDQTDRAYSSYRLFLKFNPDIFRTNYSFKDFLTYHYCICKEGFYLYHLQRYFNVYPRDAILILLYDDLQENPMAFIQQVFYFLKVDASFQPPSLYRQINPMNLVVTKSNFLRKTSQRLANHRWLTRFACLFDQLNRIPIQPSEFPPHQKITSEVRRHLADMYRQHNEQLGDFLGRDLSCWNSERD